MITLGGQYRGPELEDSPVRQLLGKAMRLIAIERGDWEEGIAPGVNVVFYVPGSLGDFPHITKIAAGRFSRKQKLLLVEVPVPREVAESGGSIEFVIDALHKANTIAAEVFARKGLAFDLPKAQMIVERVKAALVAQQA